MRKPSQEDLIKNFVVICDTREVYPYRFKNSITRKLETGDYSIIYGDKSYENEIVVERKSNVSELFAFSGNQRDRFCRELEKMKNIKYKYLLCEFDIMDIINQQPPGLLEPTIIYSTLCSFAIKYQIPFLFCGNRQNARGIMFKLFQFFVKYEILNYDNKEKLSDL